MPALDLALANASITAAVSTHLDWYFLYWQFGQCQLLGEGEVMGPVAFGLGSVFDLSECEQFSAHLVLTLCCTDPGYSLLKCKEHFQVDQQEW